LQGLPLFSAAAQAEAQAAHKAPPPPAEAQAVPAPFRTAAAALIGTAPAAEPPAPAPAMSARDTQLIAVLEQLDPDSLTPRAALEEIYRLKALLTAHSRPEQREAQVKQ